MTARVPKVVEVEPDRRWWVESRSVAPGASWLVTYALEAYSVVAPERTRWEMRCPCPHGSNQLAVPLDLRRPCAHMRAVVAAQEAKHRRTAAPINASTFVD